jgi:hypothetical protein
MQKEKSKAFNSIESALQFMLILEDVVCEASEELKQKANENRGAHHREGVYLALYKIGQLGSQVQKSRRILKELMVIRDVLMEYELAQSKCNGAAGRTDFKVVPLAS